MPKELRPAKKLIHAIDFSKCSGGSIQHGYLLSEAGYLGYPTNFSAEDQNSLKFSSSINPADQLDSDEYKILELEIK